MSDDGGSPNPRDESREQAEKDRLELRQSIGVVALSLVTVVYAAGLLIAGLNAGDGDAPFSPLLWLGVALMAVSVAGALVTGTFIRRTSASLRKLELQSDLSELSELFDERDRMEMEGSGHAASGGAGELSVTATDHVAVTDDVKAELRRSLNQRTVEQLGHAVDTAARRTWIERWSGILVAMIGALAIVVAALLTFAKSPPSDCPEFVGVLLDVNAAAADADAAVEAAGQMSWGGLDESCGDPSEFLRSLNG